MNDRRLVLNKPLVLLITISASGVAMSQGVERFDDETWNPNPKQLESTVETGEIPVSEDYGGKILVESDGGMTVDVELLAKESGMSYIEAERAIKAQDEFGRYADKLLSKYSGRIARMWKEPAPSTKSYIQFVGNVPEAVIEDVLLKKVPINISITGGGQIAFEDQAKRVQAAARGLRKAGYVDSSSAYNPESDVIELDIKVPEQARRPDPNLILNAIQSELRGAELKDQLQSITAKDVRIKTVRGDGPIMTFDHGTGGNWLRDDGFRECTSGWSVSGPSGDGIITAAHCTGLNEFEEAGGLVFDMTWRDQEFGSGDVEYHTTSHIELDDFWASSSDYRDVSSIRSTLTMWGSSVCEYGRSSNTRTCNHTVDGLFVTVNYSIGTVNGMVRVTGDNSIGGDSGGGWSFNFTAWGVHSGSNGSQSFFTPAQLAESSLNVTIKR